MENLKSLLESLLMEGFAKENRLSEKNMDEVGNVLEQSKERYESPNPDPSFLEDISRNRDSFERVREIYCQLLLEMDSRNIPIDVTETLGTLIESGTRTVVSVGNHANSKLRLAPELASEEDFETSEAEADSEAPDAALIENDEDWSRDLMWNDEPMDLPPLQPVTGTGENWRTQSPEGKTYVELAQYLDLLSKDPAFPADASYGDRIVSQNLCFALEAECIHQLKEALKAFWPSREPAIRAVLNSQSKRFELHPTLHQDLSQLAVAHANWLPEGHFSVSGILNCLHYFVSTKRAEFDPTLMESSVLLLLFARQTETGFALKRALPLEGLTSDELIECAFRLAKVQKIKSKAFNGSAPFSSEFRRELEGEFSRLLELLAKLQMARVNQPLNRMEGAA